MRTLLIAIALCVAATITAAAQDFNWHGRIASGKRLEGKGVNGDVRAVLATGAEAGVNARKHARRSGSGGVEIKVVVSGEGASVLAGFSTPFRRLPRDIW